MSATANHRSRPSFGLPAAWWPLALGSELGRHPRGYSLGGLDVAVYRDRDGVVRAVEDSCPHRRLPLSMGRITEDGYLQCAYHGWCFDGATGRCTQIPNLSEDEKVPGSIRVAAFATAENVADALGWSLRTRLAPAVGPPTGEEPEEGATMFDTRLSDGFVLIWTGADEPGEPPPARRAAGSGRRTFTGRLEVRAPHERVAEAILWNPGRALGLGFLLGGGEELGGPDVSDDGRGVSVARRRRIVELPLPHTYDSRLDAYATSRIRMAADTGLASIEAEPSGSRPGARVVVGLTPVSAYRTIVRWRGESSGGVLAGLLAAMPASAPRRASGRRERVVESIADDAAELIDDGVERLRELRSVRAIDEELVGITEGGAL